jgi:hypothetical protein
MKKIINRKMEEIDGTIYEIIQYENIVEHNGERITQQIGRIYKTPYRDQNIEVTDSTKTLINNIKNKGI